MFEGRWGWGLYRKGKKKHEKLFKIPNPKYYNFPHFKKLISADKRKYLKPCLISDANRKQQTKERENFDVLRAEGQ